MRTISRAISVFLCLLVASASFGADDALWKRVQRMDPGTRIVVTAEGATGERYLVQLNDTDLVVLNLTAPELPKSSGTALLILRSAVLAPPFMNSQRSRGCTV